MGEERSFLFFRTHASKGVLATKNDDKIATAMNYQVWDDCLPSLPAGRWIDNEQEIIVIPPTEFSFQEALVYLTRTTNECLYHVSDGKVFKLLRDCGEMVLVEIGCRENGDLVIRFVNGIPTKPVRLAIAQYVWEWFDFSTDLTSFYEIAEAQPLLKQLVAEYNGLRIIGIPDLFEALCWGIMGQQVNLAFAYTLKRRFVESFGENILWDGQQYWVFPSPDRIAQLSVDDLKALQFTTRKSEYVLEAAKQISSGILSKSGLLEMGFREAERTLVRIRGIGHWTANYVLMRCLRDPSAFPIDDVGLHNALKRILQWERKPTVEEIRTLSIGWKGWEAYATFYLWRSLQTPKA